MVASQILWQLLQGADVAVRIRSGGVEFGACGCKAAVPKLSFLLVLPVRI